jgi:hypothetical protein
MITATCLLGVRQSLPQQAGRHMHCSTAAVAAFVATAAATSAATATRLAMAARRKRKHEAVPARIFVGMLRVDCNCRHRRSGLFAANITDQLWRPYLMLVPAGNGMAGAVRLPTRTLQKTRWQEMASVLPPATVRSCRPDLIHWQNTLLSRPHAMFCCRHRLDKCLNRRRQLQL